MAINLSKNYKRLTSSPSESMEFAKKPEWYHRRPISCSNGVNSSFRTRASLSSFNPGEHVHCKDVAQDQEPLSSYMSPPIVPGLDLYCNGVHNLWRESFYNPVQNNDPDPESSGGEESDSGTDVIFLVSSAKDSLSSSPRSPFIQDRVGHIVEPLSPALSSLEEEGGCCHLSQPLSSPSPDSSYSEDSSDSSVNIPVHHNRPVVLLSDIYSHATESPVNVSSDDSDVIEVSVTSDRKKCCTTKPPTPQEESPRFYPGEVRRSARIVKPAAHATQLPCETPRYSLRKQARNFAVGIYNESCDSDDMLQYVARLSTQEAALKKTSSQPNESQEARSEPVESNVEIANEENSTLRTKQQQQPPCCNDSDSNGESKRQKPSALHKSNKLRQIKRNQKRSITSQNNREISFGGEAKKKKVAKRKKRRQTRTQPFGPFSHTEPEIALKFAKAKANKKIWKCEHFCPFVHMEHRNCTVVNFQEEANVTRNHGGGQQQSTNASSLPGFVPSTSCFQLGRPCLENRVQDQLFCCLCGTTANVLGLGDLHGPYFPTGLSVKVDKDCATAEAEDDFHRHTSSANSLENRCFGPEHSPSIGRVPDCDTSPLPEGNTQVNEFWIHEDCGIWSAGVFLVKGKLYGLREAAQVARQTVCSLCQQTGAIMGCFLKGCPRNYHYRCAVQSGCLLNEENFSMRCSEHKQNKLLTRGTRRRRR